MKLYLPVLVFALLVGSLPADVCSCQKASEADVAHGANELRENKGETVRKIEGRVIYYHDQAPSDDVVVEVYPITPADEKLYAHDIILRHKRQAACVTSKDGRFCFPDLPSGRYLVRAGTRSRHAGFNDVYIRVNVDHSRLRGWFKGNKNITLELTLGT